MNVVEEVRTAIRSASSGSEDHKKIACTHALQIAADFNISPHEVGRICNELSIKITACQLGCFK